MIDTTQLQEVIKGALMTEWSLQGHAMNSKVVNDMEFVIKQEIGLLSISGLMYPYGVYQNTGATWRKFPNVRAIQEWVKLRMAITNEKKSKSIAFAIATEFKKKGMPLPGSRKYSSTGKRDEWISEAFNRSDLQIREAIQLMIFTLLTVNIDTFTKRWNIELNKKV